MLSLVTFLAAIVLAQAVTGSGCFTDTHARADFGHHPADVSFAPAAAAVRDVHAPTGSEHGYGVLRTTSRVTRTIFARSSDRASLGRKVYRDNARGALEFMRPAFNESRDPGPPTADIFEAAPVRPQPVEFVPTPGSRPQTEPPIIGSVVVANDPDYFAESVAVEGNLLHLHIRPIRDPQRNRLREIWADKTTYELRKLVATDRLFVGTHVYGETFTITMGTVEGRPVVTDIHGKAGDGYTGDGVDVDFHFRDITFPASLPAWYFDSHAYGAHTTDAPL